MTGTNYFIVQSPDDPEQFVWQVRDDNGVVIAQSRIAFPCERSALDSINRAQRARAVYTEGP
jgi:hypothetical protein